MKTSSSSVHLAVPQSQGEIPQTLDRLGLRQTQHRSPSPFAVVLHRSLLLQTMRLCDVRELNGGLMFVRDLKVPLHHIVIRKTVWVVWREQL